MLQTQLQEAQRALEQAAQQHKDSLAALQEEAGTLLRDKIDLQKQVPAPLSQPSTLPQHSQALPLPLAGRGNNLGCLSLGGGGEAPVLSGKVKGAQGCARASQIPGVVSNLSQWGPQTSYFLGSPIDPASP